MKAKECCECEYFVRHSEYVLTGKTCQKGHKPRLYIPDDPHKGGYKRRCNDFKAKETAK